MGTEFMEAEQVCGTLVIDKEFQTLIPPLASEERQQLEQNIKKDGCRDPLVVWRMADWKPDGWSRVLSWDNPDDSGCDTEDGSLVIWKVWQEGEEEVTEHDWPLVLIDGHNRHEICGRNSIDYEMVEYDFDSRDDAKVWMIKNQFGKRNLQPFTRANLALQLEPLIAKRAKENQVERKGNQAGATCQKSDKLSSIDTKKEVAKAANVSHDTVSKVKIINKAVDAGKVAPEVIEKLRSGEVSINRVVKDVKEAATAERRSAQRKAAVEQTDVSFFDNVHVGDFRDHFSKVKDSSLSLIFTDPPYDRKAIEVYDGLGEFASSKLHEGGSLLVYVGHIQLQEALNALSKHLRYWWVCCCLHSGGESLMREYGIRVGWKAMLWFVNKTRDDKQRIVHDVVTGAREKSHHDWQQSQVEAEYWIENICPRDGIVCDPFLGGGTTAAAAIKLNRKWIAFEKDHDQAVLAMSRCKHDSAI
jgi:16S rRNA G966 N2-methylase RsmD